MSPAFSRAQGLWLGQDLPLAGSATATTVILNYCNGYAWLKRSIMGLNKDCATAGSRHNSWPMWAGWKQPVYALRTRKWS